MTDTHNSCNVRVIDTDDDISRYIQTIFIVTIRGTILITEINFVDINIFCIYGNISVNICKTIIFLGSAGNFSDCYTFIRCSVKIECNISVGTCPHTTADYEFEPAPGGDIDNCITVTPAGTC